MKIALILPVEYTGDTLEASLELCNSLTEASQYIDSTINFVYCHREHPNYKNINFQSILPKKTDVRSINWDIFSKNQCQNILINCGITDVTLTYDEYCLPNDGINYLLDCKIWFVISDRIPTHILPIRPVFHLIFDYIQRNVSFLDERTEDFFINVAHAAKRIFCTTNYVHKQLLNYVLIDAKKIKKIPPIIPFLKWEYTENNLVKSCPMYFLWVTNTAKHKNNLKVLEELNEYYSLYNGTLDCFITGINLNFLRKLLKNFDNKTLHNKLHIKGYVQRNEYVNLVKNAKFLLVSQNHDNGSYSPIEAAQIGTPSLCQDYPPMREYEQLFSLDLEFFNIEESKNLASKLKKMEILYEKKKEKINQKDSLSFRHSIEDSISILKSILDPI